MSILDKMPNHFRWALFIPYFFLTYIVLNKVLSFALMPIFGPYDEKVSFTFVAYQLYLNILSTAIAIISSAFVAPKYRRKIAIAFVIMIVLYFIANLLFMTEGDILVQNWRLLFSMVTMLIGGIWGIRVVFRKTEIQA